LPRKQRKSLLDNIRPGDAVLTRFHADQTAQVDTDRLRRLWQKILCIGRAKGWAMRQAAGVFSKEAKVPPWDAGLDVPLPVGRDAWTVPVAEWMEQHPCTTARG
jgi:hypothetical protein